MGVSSDGVRTGTEKDGRRRDKRAGGGWVVHGVYMLGLKPGWRKITRAVSRGLCVGGVSEKKNLQIADRTTDARAEARTEGCDVEQSL